MKRPLFTFILLCIFGFVGVACSKINPEVRELLSSSKPPPNPGGGEVLFSAPAELVQGSTSGYQPSAGNAGAGQYAVKMEIANEAPLSAQRSPSRSYLVTWDIPSGDELKEEGVLDHPSGFNP